MTDRDEGTTPHEGWPEPDWAPDQDAEPDATDGAPEVAPAPDSAAPPGYEPPPGYTPPPGPGYTPPPPGPGYTPPPGPGYAPPPASTPPPAGPGWAGSNRPSQGSWPAPDRAPVGSVHPLIASRALALGWALFRSRWKTLLVALALALVGAHAIDALWYLAHGDTVDRWLVELQAWSAQGTPTAPPDPATMPPAPVDALALLGLSQLVLVVTSLIAAAAAVSILGWAYGGGSIPATRALGAALARAPSLIVAWLITLLTILGIVMVGTIAAGILVGALGQGLGVFLALIAGVTGFVAVIFVSLRWALVTYTIMLEGHGPLAGLGRSWRLVAGSTWRVLGYLLLVGLLVIAIVIVFGTIAAAVGAVLATGQDQVQVTQLLSRLASLIVTILLTPWTTAVMLLLYYDLRLNAGEKLGPPAD